MCTESGETVAKEATLFPLVQNRLGELTSEEVKGNAMRGIGIAYLAFEILELPRVFCNPWQTACARQLHLWLDLALR